MNYNYRFYLSVDFPERCLPRKAVAFDVDIESAKDALWEPYDMCTDAITAAIVGGVTKSEAKRIDAEREKFAAYISRQLTAAIMEAIKSADLRNGYKQENNP